MYIHRRAEKELDDLPEHVVRRFATVFEMLEEDPYRPRPDRDPTAISGWSGAIRACMQSASGTIADCTRSWKRRKPSGSPSSGTGDLSTIERTFTENEHRNARIPTGDRRLEFLSDHHPANHQRRQLVTFKSARAGSTVVKSRMGPAAKTVDEYLASVPPESRIALQRLRKIIKAAAPDAEAVISY